MLPTRFRERDFLVAPSTLKGAGRGLFARKRIKKGENLGYYTGEVLNDRQARKIKSPLLKYLVPVVKDFQILGHTVLRFINHSYRPNARMVYSYRWKSARFEALRNIKEGEEIFIEYDQDFMKRMKMLVEN